MRRCYSTKPIEFLEAELEQKGHEYVKYLLSKALNDDALDVFEHFRLEFLVENVEPQMVNKLLISYPFASWLHLKDKDYLLAINARTIIEMLNDEEAKEFAFSLVNEIRDKQIAGIFVGVVLHEPSTG